jgi:hypothetical protein
MKRELTAQREQVHAVAGVLRLRGQERGLELDAEHLPREVPSAQTELRRDVLELLARSARRDGVRIERLVLAVGDEQAPVQP